MLESWRWFGPNDPVTLAEIRQTGATEIVSALHDIPIGEAWPLDAIRAHKALIEANNRHMTPLNWSVVESIPVHDDIKLALPGHEVYVENWITTLRNLAAENVKTICYNFMPLLDWTRTRLDAPLPAGGHALRFSQVEMAGFELHMLARDGAEADYTPEVIAAAGAWHEGADEAERTRLLTAIMAGLPGAYARYDVDGLRAALAPWDGITRDDLRTSYARFLAEVVPAAEDLGMALCVHPDDPPRPLLGLPRIVSTGDDIGWILAQQESQSNGLTLCSGSLGAHPLNDVPAIAARFADRIHFAHLRNVAKEPDGSFQEAAHLEGDTDMVALVRVLIAENARRRAAGRADIPFRPDHGHALLSDLGRDTHPGYPLIGRLRGLAELRGVIAALHN